MEHLDGTHSRNVGEPDECHEWHPPLCCRSPSIKLRKLWCWNPWKAFLILVWVGWQGLRRRWRLNMLRWWWWRNVVLSSLLLNWYYSHFILIPSCILFVDCLNWSSSCWIKLFQSHGFLVLLSLWHLLSLTDFQQVWKVSCNVLKSHFALSTETQQIYALLICNIVHFLCLLPFTIFNFDKSFLLLGCYFRFL